MVLGTTVGQKCGAGLLPNSLTSFLLSVITFMSYLSCTFQSRPVSLLYMYLVEFVAVERIVKLKTSFSCNIICLTFEL